MSAPGPQSSTRPFHLRYRKVIESFSPTGSRGGACPLLALLAEMCILHSRTTVGTALSNAKCTSRRPGRDGVGRRGPRDLRVIAEHFT